MNSEEHSTGPYPVSKHTVEFVRRSGLIECDDLNSDRQQAEAVKQLMALGLSLDEIEQLDIRQPMLQAICEHADAAGSDPDSRARAVDAVDSALSVVCDEIQNLDMELEMLQMRKRALMNRSRILRRVARSLSVGEPGSMAA